MKYAWIKEHRDSFLVSIMCDVLKVSPSGYYGSLDRAPSPRTLRHERIKQSVAHAHAESNGVYGSIKVADQLKKRDDLETIRNLGFSHFFAARAMAQAMKISPSLALPKSSV